MNPGKRGPGQISGDRRQIGILASRCQNVVQIISEHARDVLVEVDAHSFVLDVGVRVWRRGNHSSTGSIGYCRSVDRTDGRGSDPSYDGIQGGASG